MRTMTATGDTEYEHLREILITNLSVDFFEDGEIDSVLNQIDSCDPAVRQQVLVLAVRLSSASSTLVPGALRNIRSASVHLSSAELAVWLDNAFNLREGQGIEEALMFLSRSGKRDLEAFRGSEAVSLTEAAPLLETYLRAISGAELKVEAAEEVYTDTAVLYLPETVHRFPDRKSNLGLYKLAAGNCWAQIALGTCTPYAGAALVERGFVAEPVPDIRSLFALFSQQQLALDLYTLIEAFRAEDFLMKELPGQMKRAAAIKHELFRDRPPLSSLSEKTRFVEALWQYFLTGRIKGQLERAVRACLPLVYGMQHQSGSTESVRILFALYETASLLDGDYLPPNAPFFVGRIRPERIAARTAAALAEKMKRIEGIVTKLIEMPELNPPEHGPGAQHGSQQSVDPAKEYLMIKGRLIEFNDDLKSLVHEKGGIPGGILVKGSEIGGASELTLLDLLEEEGEEPGAGAVQYDEWDYRRQGYRRGWCTLREQVGPAGETGFVDLTLKRYAGAIVILRKKFELLRRERRLLYRQKDGDDIDLDAVVASFSDIRAGVSPSDNLYVRTERQERSIAVLFLIDMSGSTRGWVNRAEKESLVLMSEALEALGDRYAIYGFSSMTRARCDVFRIKAFEEAYSESVKRRIAGIEPRDYTRMGPFIRHASSLLGTADERTKLLITLSDSKPEDWDAYKGNYAVEDTRRALIEAKARGIHPFCITIDQEAQSYLPHLFGEVNYIFINDVHQLPGRITEIYCRLTA